MDELNELKRIFNKEIDEDFDLKRKESKQQRGFIPEGKKIVNYIAKNYIEIFEIESSIEYGMEYLNFMRLVEIMGFDEKKLDRAKGKLLNGFYVIFDFDDKLIGIHSKDGFKNPLGGYLTEGKEKHEGVFGDEELDESDYDAETFSKWYHYINKN